MVTFDFLKVFTLHFFNLFNMDLSLNFCIFLCVTLTFSEGSRAMVLFKVPHFGF